MRDRQIVTNINLDDGEVRFVIAADELGLMLCLVIEPHGDFLSLLNHVMVGQNITSLIDDEPCTGAAALEIAIRLIRPSGHTKKIKKIKRIGRLAIIATSAACGRGVYGRFRIDVDYRRI